jgi:CRP/FNR family transcriptional regulator, cyclic AMP receptor protein
MSVSPADLQKLPLFSRITEPHLKELIAAFRERKVASGEVLFEAGSIPQTFVILTEGDVLLREGETERFRLKPIAPVGELGALTRIERRLTAVAGSPAVVLELAIDDLMQFFEEHGDVAFPFHYNLLRVVADKIRRDRRRMEEMRHNIVTTQKAMKRMRDALLDGDDTPLSKQLFDELEKLIEQNKKGRYLVPPADALPTRVRLDDGSVVPVAGMSKEWLHLECAQKLQAGKHWSGVLCLPEREIAVSGNVDHAENGIAYVRLDLLIDDYAQAVDDHVTRLSMLDVVL